MYPHIYYDVCKPECINGDLDQFLVDYFCKPNNNN